MDEQANEATNINLTYKPTKNQADTLTIKPTNKNPYAPTDALENNQVNQTNEQKTHTHKQTNV